MSRCLIHSLALAATAFAPLSISPALGAIQATGAVSPPPGAAVTQGEPPAAPGGLPDERPGAFRGGPPNMPPPPKMVEKPFPRNAWGKPNFNAVWSHDFMARQDKVFYALPVFGGLPDLSMMQPWVAQHYRQNYDAMQAGKQALSTALRCLPAGVPNIMMEAHAMQVILTKDEFIVLVESDHQVRIVPIGPDLRHAVNIRPSWNGDSIGHWEGDTLVIDTVGLTDRSELDPMGTPHSTEMHVVERIYYDKYARMVIDTTINDPKALVRPWSYSWHYAKGGREAQAENVAEYACAENNRDGVITPEQQ